MGLGATFPPLGPTGQNITNLLFFFLNKSSFLDCNVKPNSLYEYYILPYVEGKNGIKFGNKIYLPKIKTPTEYVGEDWWIDDID